MATDAGFPSEALWERFLDGHALSAERESEFLDYLGRPDLRTATTVADLEEAYQHFRETHPDLT